MKHILSLLNALLLAPLALLHAADTPPAPMPNIIVILSDDLGYGDVGCYGATKIKTPHIDRLAKEGMRFTQALTPSSVCSPTRYGLLAGRYCWRNALHAPTGVHGAGGPLLFEADRLTLPKMLRAAGYSTAAVGKWHLGFGCGTNPRGKFDWTAESLRLGPQEAGFDHFFGMAANVENEPRFFIEDDRFVGQRPVDNVTVIRQKNGPDKVRPWSPEVEWDDSRVAGRITQHAADWLRARKGGEQPFVLYFASNIAHMPITPSAASRGKSGCGLYGDFVQELDAQVGMLLDALAEAGKLDNTLILFTSDNGGVVTAKAAEGAANEARRAGHRINGDLRGGKAGVYEGGFRVPFLARWPGVVKAGTTNDQLICLTDIFATLAEALGITVPPGAAEDSVSFLSALAPERAATSATKPRQTVVLHSMDGIFAIRAPRWKLIAETILPQHTSDRASIIEKENINQLYDLQNDPAETTNLFDTQPEVAQRMARELAATRKASTRSSSPATSAWWQQMFSLAFDGHGNFVAPHFAELKATAASLGAVGFHGVWDADLNHDMPWMLGHAQAFDKHPGTKRVIYIEGCGATKVLARVSADGRVLFTADLLDGSADPVRRRYIENQIKPDGRTIWFGDWQFMQPHEFKTSLGKPLPGAKDMGLPAFTQPLDGSVIKNEADFWRTRAASALIGKGGEGLEKYAAIPADIAAALDLKNITTQRADGQWLVKSGDSLLYDAQIAPYQAAKARRAMQTLAPDMIHYDDWDLRSPTAMGAKADIHVAAFREFVKRRFSAEDCRALGFDKANVASFDVLRYLLNPPWRSEHRGEGDDPQWRCAADPRWLGDNVWRAFQIACIEDRLASMKEVYRLNKAAARELGRDVPMVANIIPTLSATFLQSDCVDMANFEWPCFKTYGSYPNPFGYYPQARLGIGPRMASKIGTTGHAMVDPYVEEKHSGWDGKGFTRKNGETLHKVIYFDLIANRGIPAFALTWEGAYSPGSVHSAGQLHAFMNAVAPIISGRDYLADIGLAASAWSQIAAQTPFGGWNHEVSKRHLAEFIGWSQYLASARAFPQWDVLPFDDVKPADLTRFKLIILPSVLVITADQLTALEAYLKQGGKLLITGETGTFNGPKALLMPRTQDLIVPLAERYPSQVTLTKTKPGLDYHLDRQKTAALKTLLQQASTHQPVLTATGDPEHIGIYASASRTTRGELTVDLVNYHHDLATDQLTPVTATDFHVRLHTPKFTAAPHVEVIRYDETAPHNLTRCPLAPDAIRFEDGQLTLRVPPFTHYQLLRLSPR